MPKDSILLIAAFGRSDPTKEAAIAAWNRGKDFQIYKGPYCSIRDIEFLRDKYPGGIYIRYGILPNYFITRIL